MDRLPRTTPATADVLAALLAASDGVWGLLIIKESGRPAGTVYPILDRLEDAGWIDGHWEESPDRKGPRRRFYRLLPAARQPAEEYVAEIETRTARRSRASAPEGGTA